jgi:hypothetical protein
MVFQYELSFSTNHKDMAKQLNPCLATYSSTYCTGSFGIPDLLWNMSFNGRVDFVLLTLRLMRI